MRDNKLIGLLATIAAVLWVEAAVAQAPGGCGDQPACAEVREFTAAVTNFRPSTLDVRTRAIAVTLRFENRTAEPLILGYVNESAVITDDQGNRYLATPSSVRGIGLITAREFDPKFVLQPGEASDARLELVMRQTGANPIRGTKFEMDLAVRQVEPLPGNQFRLGKEHALHFGALGPSAMADGAATPAAPATTNATAEPSPAATPQPEADPCEGKNRCYGAGPFIAEVTRVTPSTSGRHHVLELAIKFSNLTAEPLILAYSSGSSSAVDNYGNRYLWGRPGTHDVSVKGIGIVTGRSANPQFALKPGQSRTASFTVIRYNATGPIGSAWAYNVAIQQLEILPSNQIRSVRDYTVDFQDLSANAAAAGAKKLLDALRKPKP